MYVVLPFVLILPISPSPVRIERDLVILMPKRDWWGFNHRLVLYGRHFCPARKHACGTHPLTDIYPPAVKKWPRAA